MEYSEDGKQDVVELSDSVVGADPIVPAAVVTAGALPKATGIFQIRGDQGLVVCWR